MERGMRNAAIKLRHSRKPLISTHAPTRSHYNYPVRKKETGLHLYRIDDIVLDDTAVFSLWIHINNTRKRS